MISFGCGVNSVAMTIMLINGGWRGPIVMADTGNEHPETMCYLEYFGKWLAERELEIMTLSPATHPDLYGKRERETGSLEAFCLMRGIIPLLASRWCSQEWKQRPLDKWRKAHGIATTLQGICASEPQRIRDDSFVRYPLYEEGITRGECKCVIQRAGLALPIKSGCFFCPGQRLANWKRLYYGYPELYERAALIEESAQHNNQKWATLDPHGISLREHARRRWEGQLEMDLSRWLPCACSL